MNQLAQEQNNTLLKMGADRTEENSGKTLKICITNRVLLTGTTIFNAGICEQILERLTLIGKKRLADAVILREKDLSVEEYQMLAKKSAKVCKAYDLPLILHHFHEAEDFFEKPLPLHLSMEEFRAYKAHPAQLERVAEPGVTVNSLEIGVSTHTVEEAMEAERLGASYITASHIFPTECKKGLAPRGLEYLRKVCSAVHIPVYALGGIHPHNAGQCIEAGSAGVCMMSEYFGRSER
ncbi:MAG: thiamine phosphate synthase [Lachnospiraceae bacterium]|nr:thiamine phosphate synthase [Lachnospiraceae bacterium]